MKKKISLNNLIMVVLFVIVIVAIPILTKIEPIQSTSRYENRTLATVPEFSKESLYDGSYFENWETYFKDHIYKRDLWLLADVIFQKDILHYDVVNGIVVMDDLLLPYMSPVADDQTIEERAQKMAQNISSLNEEIESYGGEFIYVGIPEQYSALRDRYPKHMFNNEDNLNATEEYFFGALSEYDIDYIDMREIFMQGNIEDYYLKTDHHFNLNGAYLTYQKICEKLNEDGYI